MSRLPHTGEAVIIDVGEGKDIHPRNKQDVGHAAGPLGPGPRLRGPDRPSEPDLQIHGEARQQGRPHVRPCRAAGSRPSTSTEARGSPSPGATTSSSGPRRVTGPNKVEVWSDEVAEPVAVRYAWADNPVCNLYSAEGLPATPFRTDDWPGVTINNVK